MNKEAMFEEISRIMQEDMAPTMGCTGPISYIFSAAAARELAGRKSAVSDAKPAVNSAPAWARS